MARRTSIRLVEEAFARAGRDEAGLLREAVDALSWADAHETPRNAAARAIVSCGLRVAEGSDPIVILPFGRDPALVAAIEALDHDEAAMRERIRAIARERGALIVEAVGRRLTAEGRPVPADIDPSGSHACDGSPSGLCCYDPREDPARDQCLFCGGPDERR